MEHPFGIGYILAITEEEIKDKWENLKKSNFHFTSRNDKKYNCVAWALGVPNKDIDMLWFRDMYDLETSTLDHSANGYAECFNRYFGFKICDNGELEEGFDKIALYEDSNHDFVHVARRLDNGNWTSKMGKYEDIEHYSLESVSGTAYGNPVLFMKRPIQKK